MKTENKSFFRFPAEKVSVQELEAGEYIEEKEQNPDYILVNENKKIFRINVVATVVHKELRGSVTSILMDDGTGKIIVRIFEENKTAMNSEVGDVVQIIGRMRTFNREKYIFPEIIKRINPSWLKVRYLELQKEKRNTERREENNLQAGKKEIKNIEDKKEDLREAGQVKKTAEENTNNFEIDKVWESAQNTSESPHFETQREHSDPFSVVSEEIEENDPLLPFEKLSKLISGLDKGDGVMIEEIIEKSPLEKTEEFIEKMLENGEIFQNMPGKVRLL